MASAVINTRKDLDAIAGTPQHEAFMAMLAGTLWRLEKDDIAKTWKAVDDEAIVGRFGFTRADFPKAVAPELPAYSPPEDTAAREAEQKAVHDLRLAVKASTMFKALENADLVQINAWVDNNFGSMNAQQRAFLKLMAVVAGMYLRERP